MTATPPHERVAPVDVVITSSAALWKKFENCGNDRIMVRNAYDMDALPPLPNDARFDAATTAQFRRDHTWDRRFEETNVMTRLLS